MVKILDVVERLMRMDRLIRDGKTGSAKRFATELGISRSHLFNHFEELKDLGVDIKFNKANSSYEYCGDLEPQIQKPLKVIRKRQELSDTYGGNLYVSPSLLDCIQLILSDY